MNREQLIKKLRSFFDQKNFHEVQIPVFNSAVPAEENIHPFIVNGFYLSTSPERALKLELAKGIGNCYGIGHSFRDLEGTGPNHTPEFLMLEWYRESADYKNIMDDVKELFRKFGIQSDWQTFSLSQLFSDIGINLEKDDLVERAKEKGYNTADATWSQMFDQIFLNEIEPKLPNTAFFLVDFPTRISRLCKLQKDRPFFAERFEAYVGGLEIGNGNTEETDVSKLQSINDLEFLEALSKMHGKNYAGIGIGIERLLKVLPTSVAKSL
ncbi:MAG TPA: amino acid--tRNA ligase-related protein [Patescibacteria group bacterium]|nr:amino acid--tRNA ligase-related protein [Patescibacteria group bacterium]